MNYKKLVLLGLVSSSAMFLPACNRNVPVYGPPAPNVMQQQTEVDSEYDSEADSGSEFDPSLNELPEVYGPPVVEWDEDESETISSTPLISDKSKFDPKKNMIPSVYGPPPAKVKSADDSEVMK